MPPRFAYWTILVDEQPTAFRAAMQEDLQPTFNRLKEKHASARLVWFQNGKVWNSRLDAQEAMYARGEMGRANDSRQRETLSERRPSHRDGRRESKGGFRDRKRESEPRPERDDSGKLAWKPKGAAPPAEEGRVQRLRPDWKPKQKGLAPRDHLLRRSVVKDAKAAWKPKGDRKPEWRPKGTFSEPEGRVRRSAQREGGTPSRPRAREGGKPSSPRGAERQPLEWKPKGAATGAPKRKWIPKEEYKKQQGIEAKRDQNWRPGGAHKDPRQKYKDAKKAKWTRFKQNIRKNWERKQDGAPRKKRRDEE